MLGGYEFTVLKQQFFPDDLQYWSYVDVWLPNDAPLSATNNATLCVEELVREVADRYGRGMKRLSPEAARLLATYRWPGNIRELRNVLERVYVETVTDVIGRGAFAEWESERDTLAAGVWSGR